MTPPKLLVVLECGAAPRLVVDAATDAEYERLLRWLRSRPELRAVARELEPARERRGG